MKGRPYLVLPGVWVDSGVEASDVPENFGPCRTRNLKNVTRKFTVQDLLKIVNI